MRIVPLGDHLHRQIPVRDDSDELLAAQIPNDRQCPYIVSLHQLPCDQGGVARLAEDGVLGHDVPALFRLDTPEIQLRFPVILVSCCAPFTLPPRSRPNQRCIAGRMGTRHGVNARTRQLCPSFRRLRPDARFLFPYRVSRALRIAMITCLLFSNRIRHTIPSSSRFRWLDRTPVRDDPSSRNFAAYAA